MESLTGLWRDGGAALLKGAGFSGGWADVIGLLPEEVLRTDPKSPVRGEILLGRLRDLYGRAGREREALAFARATHDRLEAKLGAGHAETLRAAMRLGDRLDRLGRADEATDYLEVAWKGLYAALGSHKTCADAARILARNLRNRGRLPPAESRLRDALAIQRIVAPHEQGLLLAQLAEIRQELVGDELAAPDVMAAWEVLVRERGEHDRLTLDRARILGPLWLRLNEPHQAVRVLTSLWDWTRAQGDDADRARVSFDLGRALDGIGEEERGMRLMAEGLRLTRTLRDEATGAPHPDLPQRLATWARVHEFRGRRQEAEGYLLEAVEIDKQIHGAASAQVGIRQAAVGDLVYRMERLDEAIGWMDAGLGLLRAELGDESELTALVAERLVDLLLEKADECFDVLRDPNLGWEYIYQGRGITLDVLGPDHPSHKTLKYYRDGKPRR